MTTPTAADTFQIGTYIATAGDGLVEMSPFGNTEISYNTKLSTQTVEFLGGYNGDYYVLVGNVIYRNTDVLFTAATDRIKLCNDTFAVLESRAITTYDINGNLLKQLRTAQSAIFRKNLLMLCDGWIYDLSLTKLCEYKTSIQYVTSQNYIKILDKNMVMYETKSNTELWRASDRKFSAYNRYTILDEKSVICVDHNCTPENVYYVHDGKTQVVDLNNSNYVNVRITTDYVYICSNYKTHVYTKTMKLKYIINGFTCDDDVCDNIIYDRDCSQYCDLDAGCIADVDDPRIRPRYRIAHSKSTVDRLTKLLTDEINLPLYVDLIKLFLSYL